MPEGVYTVKLIRGDQTFASTLTLVSDPRSKHTAEDRALQQKTVHELYGTLETLTFLADAVVDARRRVEARASKLSQGDGLAKRLATLTQSLDQLHKGLVATREGRLSGEEQLREKLGSLYGAVNGHDGRPTESQLAYKEVLTRRLQETRDRFDTLMGKEAAALERELQARSLEPIRVLSREDWAEAGEH